VKPKRNMTQNFESFKKNIKSLYKKQMLDSLVAFWAFRYCLGRKTYAVKYMVDYLDENWKKLDATTRELIIKEVKEALVMGLTGDDCDTELWKQFLDDRDEIEEDNND